MTMASRAVVLSGGGAAGGAWMLGILNALRGEGADLGDADLIVGTSAGARVAAALATGALRQAAQQCRDGLPATWVPVALGQFVEASMRIIADSPTEVEAARRIANMGPLGDRLASGADRRRVIASQLPVQEWPGQRLVITAVEAESGRRVSFDAASGVGLVDAVTASGALPGVYPLVPIGGRRYADGGVASLYNADLAAGHDVVIVLTPAPPSDYLRAKLDAEIAALGALAVHVVSADEQSLAAIGPDPNSAAAAREALEAGAAQGRREVVRLKPVWRRPEPARPLRRCRRRLR
jgi:NTE family protein